MSYLNFSEALAEAKRKAALQGREVTQQEAAGLSEGIAESASSNAAEFAALEQSEEQFEQSLAEQKSEYEGTMAENTRQFNEQLAESSSQFKQQMEMAQQEYELSVQALEAQIQQYAESNALQREMFGEQMEYQIAESAREAAQWQSEYETAKSQWESEYSLLEKQTQAQIDAANSSSSSGCCIVASVASNREWYPGMTEAEQGAIDAIREKLITGKNTVTQAIYQWEAAKAKISTYAIEVARIYRDVYMPAVQLRGYYMVAEWLVPRMLRSEKVMQWVRDNFIESLLPYCEHRIGLRHKRAAWDKYLKARAFLSFCSLVGMTRRSFTRCNGEVF